MSEPDRPSSVLRHPEILIAPGITFLAVIAILVVARVYDRLPVHAPECGFRERFSIPCAGCGGTRSMQALSKGKVASALHFHPAAVFGVFASFLWFLQGLQRFQRGDMPTPPEEVNRRFRRGVIIAIAILLANWIYLIFFLP